MHRARSWPTTSRSTTSTRTCTGAATMFGSAKSSTVSTGGASSGSRARTRSRRSRSSGPTSTCTCSPAPTAKAPRRVRSRWRYRHFVNVLGTAESAEAAQRGIEASGGRASTRCGPSCREHHEHLREGEPQLSSISVIDGDAYASLESRLPAESTTTLVNAYSPIWYRRRVPLENPRRRPVPRC